MRWPARATSSPSASPTTPTCGGSAASARSSGARCSPTACQKADDPRGVFQTYYEWGQRVERIKPYQVLALNRGEAEKVLRVRVAVPERDWQAAIASAFRPDRRSPLSEHMQLAIADAAERLLLPAIERDVRRDAERAGRRARYRRVRGQFAPACSASRRWPVIPLAASIPASAPAAKSRWSTRPASCWKQRRSIRIHLSINARRARKVLSGLGRQHGITLWAIGNGTASRETEQLIAELIRGDAAAHYLMVSEAGASVYSASPLARAELPELDVSMRGAVSIARRVQDPLAELVKIDPTIDRRRACISTTWTRTELATALAGVVESVVNRVGVDLNTASPALLTYVAGIGPKLAERIVAYRDASGPFPNRAALRKVTGLGPKAFEQAAGFLRVREGDTPLDASAIHPESYAIARALLKRAGIAERTPLPGRRTALDALRAEHTLDQLAAELGTGVPTLDDILEQLLRPGRDPRADLPAPILRSDVLSLDDLTPGLRLQGTVRNVVDFGAFVDIGVKQDGLLHRSQMPPGTVLRVGDIVEVEIQSVEAERGRIALGWASAK